MKALAAKGPPGWWVVALALAGLVWLLSSRGSTPLPAPHPLDWLAHTLIYLALGFSLGKATGNWRVAWVAVAWFGALDEVHQAFVPPREATIGDWWFDLLGSGLGAHWAARRGEKAAQDHDSDEDGPGAASLSTEQGGLTHTEWPQYDITFDEAQ